VLGNRLEFVDENDKSSLLQNLPTKVDHTNLTLWLASCAEIQSEHPVSRAIVNSAKSMWGSDVTFSNEGVKVTDFNVVPGSGVECCVYKENWGSYNVRVGTREFTKGLINDEDTREQLVKAPSLDYDSKGDNEVERLRSMGQISVYLSVLKNPDVLLSHSFEMKETRRRRIIGVLGIIDPIKKEAKSTVNALQNMGIDVYMCTGDHELTACSVAEQIGIPLNNVRSSMKPEQKAEMVVQLQNEKPKSLQRWTNLKGYDYLLPMKSSNDNIGGQSKESIVAMVGDGINDAIALAQSNVGIAIGAGTEVAVEAANIVLLRSNLYDVAVAIHLSKIVFKRIQMNFVWAMGYNLLAVPFASGLLYPIIGIKLPPAYAGLMMAFSSVSVVTSSLLLRNYKPPKTFSGEVKKQAVVSKDLEMASFLGNTETV